MSDESASDRDERTGRFLPGNTGAGGGRRRGSRNRLAEQFVTDFLAAWEAHGADALMRVAAEDPASFVRVAASLLPRKIEVERVDLTDEQLVSRIQQLAAELGVEIGAAGGTGAADRGAQTAH
jgi:hypothetical protein